MSQQGAAIVYALSQTKDQGRYGGDLAVRSGAHRGYDHKRSQTGMHANTDHCSFYSIAHVNLLGQSAVPLPRPGAN